MRSCLGLIASLGLWHSVYEMDIVANAPIFALVTLVAAIPLTFAYHEVAYSLKLKCVAPAF